MRRITNSVIFIATVLMAIGCAKQPKVGPNDASQRYFQAWLKVNGIDVEPSGRGIYVLEDTPGTGREISENGFAFLEYTTTDLEGNITSYTNIETAQQLGDYSYPNYYGPQFINTYEGNLYAGVSDMIIGMKVGGHKKAIIPGWLMSYKDYETESEYLAASTNQETLIYDVNVKAFTTDIDKWECDTILRMFNNNKLMIDGVIADQLFTKESGMTLTIEDTLKTGFWYKQLKAPADTASFPSDTLIYINYTGMTLDGKVFDTSYEDVAKDHQIYTAGKTYEPVVISWPSEGEEYTKMGMGPDENEIIAGFALTLWQMHPMESGIGVFYSPLGYSSTGSGASIPGYAPLIFKIDIVEEPTE